MKRRASGRKAKPGSGTLLIAIFVAIAVLVLLLRMLTFVAGHGRHHY